MGRSGLLPQSPDSECSQSTEWHRTEALGARDTGVLRVGRKQSNREGPVGGKAEGRWAAGKGEAVGGVGATAPIRRLSSKCPNK